MVARTRSPKGKRVIVEGAPGGLELRGAALDLWRSDDHEVIIGGPAETGKTFAALVKLDTLLHACPGAQAVLVRRVRDTIYSTVLQTYMRKVQPFPDGRDTSDTGVRRYGGERPVWFDYPNGARLWLAGIDDPGKALSSERDFIYVNQAEELTHDDWQVLTTRATGRAGNAPMAQVFGDCNPGPPHHWIKNRDSLRFLESRHEDNPTLYDADRGEWTEQGRKTIAILDALTGVRKERLRFGRWKSAEGTVYEFDPRIHVVDPFPIPTSWVRFRSIDFGYTNPFVCGWWALDPDGRMYLYREIYMTQRTVKVHAEQIKRLERWYVNDDGKTPNPARERIETTVADHDAEDRATLAECGILTRPADKALSPGIQAVESRLAVAGDGRPRLFVLRGCLVERDDSLAEARRPVCTEQEFDVYAWPKGSDGRAVKEVPLDVNNHGMDQTRYATRWADGKGRGQPTIVTSQPARGPAGYRR